MCNEKCCYKSLSMLLFNIVWSRRKDCTSCNSRLSRGVCGVMTLIRSCKVKWNNIFLSLFLANLWGFNLRFYYFFFFTSLWLHRINIQVFYSYISGIFFWESYLLPQHCFIVFLFFSPTLMALKHHQKDVLKNHQIIFDAKLFFFLTNQTGVFRQTLNLDCSWFHTFAGYSFWAPPPRRYKQRLIFQGGLICVHEWQMIFSRIRNILVWDWTPHHREIHHTLPRPRLFTHLLCWGRFVSAYKFLLKFLKSLGFPTIPHLSGWEGDNFLFLSVQTVSFPKSTFYSNRKYY